MRPTDCNRRGFSLMEVTTALGVISFALVALLGVFPLGLDNARMSADETRASQLTSMIFSTLATEASDTTGTPPVNVIRCFSTALDPLTLPPDGTTYDAAASVPEVVTKLYASYDAFGQTGTADPSQGQPKISRDPSAAATAIYQIDLTLRPRTFSYEEPPTSSTSAGKAKKRVVGYDALVGFRGLRKDKARAKPFFETSSFVPSFPRAAYAK